jgi:hypothetical protein
VHVTGTNTGTDMCLTIGSVTFPTLPGDVRRAKIPYGIAPGTYQMTIEGPGGSTQKEFTITPGEAPEITGISPMTASPGALVTLTGTGFMGLTEVTVIHFTSRTGPPDQVVNAPATVDRAGKSLTFNLPANIAAGYARVQTEKPSCGFDEVPLTVNF